MAIKFETGAIYSDDEGCLLVCANAETGAFDAFGVARTIYYHAITREEDKPKYIVFDNAGYNYLTKLPYPGNSNVH